MKKSLLTDFGFICVLISFSLVFTFVVHQLLEAVKIASYQDYMEEVQ